MKPTFPFSLRFDIALCAAGLCALGASILPHDADAHPTMRFESQNVTTPSAASIAHSPTLHASPKTTQNSDSPKNTDASTNSAKAKSPWAFPVPDPVLPPKNIKKIVIDPGHGGTNEGAIGIAGIHEKHLTLQVALLLADKLQKRMPDLEITLTRTRDDDLTLAERIQIANDLDADLFLSLHFNSSKNPDAIGFESFWGGDFWQGDMKRDGIEITPEITEKRTRLGALGYRMADAFNRAMRHRFDVLDRGVKPGDYTVLTRAEVPAVVLEMAFLSHPKEGISATQPNHMSKLADALADAVVNYNPPQNAPLNEENSNPAP